MKIDARGISCPQPVMMARDAAKEGLKEIEILVDNGAPKNNVPRFLKNEGYKVEITEVEDGILIKARK